MANTIKNKFLVPDYQRAQHMISKVELAYATCSGVQRKQYFQCLIGVLVKMPLVNDITYRFLTEWITATLEGNTQKVKSIEKRIRIQKFRSR